MSDLRGRVAAATARGPLAALSVTERLLVLAGGVVVAAGAALLVAGTVLPGSGPPSAVRNPAWILPLVAFALLEGLVLLVLARGRRPAPSAVDDRRATEATAPLVGTDFDTDRRRREAMTALAVDLVAAAEGVGEATARERVRRGDWTDDPVAAAYLGDDDAALVGLRERVRAWASSTDREELWARRTVAELQRVAEEGEP